MREVHLHVRLAAYLATAGTVSAVDADIQLYDGPAIDLSGNVELGPVYFSPRNST